MFIPEVYWAVSRQILLLVVFVIVASALLFVPLPIAGTYAGRTIENAGHMPLFFVGTFFVISILRSRGIEGARLYATAGLIAAGAGFLSELIQKPLQRDASWEDVFADTVGVICALAVHVLFVQRDKVSRSVRVPAVVIALACFALYVTPIINMTRAYLYRNAQFPVLASFKSDTELFWIVRVGVDQEIRDGALDVQFLAAEFPGVSFHEPVRDWRRFKSLAIDVENPDAESLSLTVRVHDVGRGRYYHDRFNRNFTFAPGERRTLRIDLEDIRRAPRKRLMNMAQISDVTLFRGHTKGSNRMRLHGMRLD
jgi:VanZ family protein